MKRNWIWRYKLHHVAFWCLYHYLWWTVAVANPFKAAATIMASSQVIVFAFYVVLQAAAVYTNLYWLAPVYLERGKYTRYALGLTGTVLLSSIGIVSGYYLTAMAAGQTVATMFGANTCFFYFFARALPSTVASVTLAFCVRLVLQRMSSLRHRQLLEKERLQAELQLLKHQFNPHFLFNSINAIFFLIETNPRKASASLAKFSELLRHQLYDCNDSLIPLSKEIGYLQNFIGLEQMRQRNLQVHFDIAPAYTGHLVVPPFVLVTFVENAFKHVSRHKEGENKIDIRLALTANTLHFDISNTTSPADKINTTEKKYGGIGLQNVRRRLALLYPHNNYALDITATAAMYTVNLVLPLQENVLPEWEDTAAKTVFA